LSIKLDGLTLFTVPLLLEPQLGIDHPNIASSLNNLAFLYSSQGRYSKAESLYKRSLKINERQLGSNHPLVATSLNNLASLYSTFRLDGTP